VEFFVDERSWPETSTCFRLGGCDADGVPVYIALTRTILEVHAEMGLQNPRLQCRYGAGLPAEYLDLLSKHILRPQRLLAVER
jgi:pyruvate-formate lyase